MHVDVDHLGRHVDPQKRDRIAPREQQPAIGLAQGVLQRAIANRAAVEKQILQAGVGPAVVGGGDKPFQPHPVVLAGNRDQVGRQVMAEKRRDPAPPIAAGRQIVERTRVVLKRAMHVRVGQRQPREGLAHVPHFGLRGAHEFAPHRRVVKQLPNLDRRAHRTAAGPDGLRHAAGDFELAAGVGRARAAAQDHAADFRDRGQRLAAKTERLDPKQILRVDNLARGVAGHGQRQLIGRDAAAVVS